MTPPITHACATVCRNPYAYSTTPVHSTSDRRIARLVPMSPAIRSKISDPKNATNCTMRMRPIKNDSLTGNPLATKSSCARKTDAIEITVWMPSLNAM